MIINDIKYTSVFKNTGVALEGLSGVFMGVWEEVGVFFHLKPRVSFSL